MRLIDESPGLFFALANLVVYSVIGIEIAMWTIASVLFVALTLALIASIALAIGIWMHRLLEDESATRPAVAVSRSATAPAPTRQSARRRARPAVGGLTGPAVR